jgi:hypothetical protein
VKAAQELHRFDDVSKRLAQGFIELMKQGKLSCHFLRQSLQPQSSEGIETAHEDTERLDKDFWDGELTKLCNEIFQLSAEHDECGASSPYGTRVLAYSKLLEWVNDAKKLTHQELWGDVIMQDVDALLQEVQVVLDENFVKSTDSLYVGALLWVPVSAEQHEDEDDLRMQIDQDTSKVSGEDDQRGSEEEKLCNSGGTLVGRTKEVDADAEGAEDAQSDNAEDIGGEVEAMDDDADQTNEDSNNSEADEDEPEPASGDESQTQSCPTEDVDLGAGKRRITRRKEPLAWSKLIASGGVVDDPLVSIESLKREAVADPNTDTTERKLNVRGRHRRRVLQARRGRGRGYRRGSNSRRRTAKRERDDTEPEPERKKTRGHSRRARGSRRRTELKATTLEELRKRLDSFQEQPATEGFKYLVDFWSRVLRKLMASLQEARSWAAEVRRMLRASRKVEFDKLRDLMQQGVSHGYQMREAVALKEEWERVNKWLEASTVILSRQKKPTIDDLKALIKEGEKMCVLTPDLETLRDHYRVAKSWLAKLHQTGVDKGTATVESLQVLLPEADSLHVDVTAETSMIQQATCMYCLCRASASGLMVECDSCTEWYHLACVGLSKAQADRVVEYTCVRCHLKTQFIASLTCVANCVNRWSVPLDLERAQENRRLKLAKKVRREQRDLDKKEAEWQALATAALAKKGVAQAAAAAAAAAASSRYEHVGHLRHFGMQADRNGITMGTQLLLTSLEGQHLEQLQKLDQDIQEARTRVETARAEESRAYGLEQV